MSNKEMMEALLTRRSCSVFTAEPICAAHLDQILSSAMVAHDHGRLEPWEFHVFQGDGRRVLADAFIRHAVDGDGDQRSIDKAAAAPYRAPTVVCVATRYQDGKIPRHEQAWSAAAACQLLTMSAHLLGHGATWKTGSWATSVVVKEAIGLHIEQDIVGFIYLGRPAMALAAAREISLDRIKYHA